MALWLVLLLTAAPPSSGQEQVEDELRRAKNEYAYGNYDNAVGVLTNLLYPMRLYTDAQVIEARKYLGLTYFLLDRRDEMREEFLKLLFLEPDYELDPFTIAPAVIDEFEKLRRQKQVELDVIRQRKTETRLERTGDPGTRRVIEQRVIELSDAVTLMPFGLGQFQNGDIAWGVTFLISEVLLLAANVGSYLWALSLRNREDDALYRGLTITQYASLAAFGVTYSLGIIHSRLHFVPTLLPPPTVRDEPVSHGPLPSRSGIGVGLRIGLSLDP